VIDLAGHRSPNTPKNFEFRNMPFREAVERVEESSRDKVEGVVEGAVEGAVEGVVEGAVEGVVEGVSAPVHEPLLSPCEKYYLRSVGINTRNDTH